MATAVVLYRTTVYVIIMHCETVFHNALPLSLTGSVTPIFVELLQTFTLF